MGIEEIYREVAPKLQSYLMGNGCSCATACDIVQETFLRLWKRRDELVDDLHQVSGLAFTIARNCQKDLARKAKHETLGFESDETDCEPASPGSLEDVRPGEVAEESADLRRRLKSMLERMPVQLLEAFALSRLGRLTVKDIARGTGLSEANVKIRVHRARKQFDVLFRSEGEVRADAGGMGDLKFAVLKAMMMLAAADGEIDKDELSLYREFADKFRGKWSFDGVWEQSVRAMAFIGFLSEMLTPEELVCEYVREAAAGFAAAESVTSERVREIVSSLERMAAADGDYSRIERACVSALAERLA